MKDLEQIIRGNPGCLALVDNDYWELRKPLPGGWDEMPDVEKDDWIDDPSNTLATARDEFKHERNLGYVKGPIRGGDLLIILAKMQGVMLEGV